jgi:hypothetical protein
VPWRRGAIATFGGHGGIPAPVCTPLAVDERRDAQGVGTTYSSMRPAVLSNEVRQNLGAYRGFRHVVRNVYAVEFDPGQVAPLMRRLPDVCRHRRTGRLCRYPRANCGRRLVTDEAPEPCTDA